MDKNKKILTILITLTIIFTAIGSSLAYLSWVSSEEQKTQITFTATAGFSCSVDGGGNITEGNVNIVPTLVNDSTTGNYIKRTVSVKPTITDTNKTIYMDLWLDINSLGTGLSSSTNFKYALTTSSDSPTTGVVSSGSFNSKKSGDKVYLFVAKEYSATTTDTYYLWIWLDAEETSSETMNQIFSLSLNGNCMDNYTQANKPDIEDGMIPVVISADGVTSTISKDDASWYNYNNQEWANMVLVSDSSRSTYQNTSGVVVNEDDILAYYVWIPRYKYKIWTTSNSSNGSEQEIDIIFESKDNQKSEVIYKASCASLSNQTLEEYPECYSLPYLMSDSDKTLLINWWYSLVQNEFGYTSFTLEEATTDVNNALQTGTLSNATLGIEVTTSEFISIYNNENSDNQITYTMEFYPLNETEVSSVGQYITHPAFTFGDVEVNGIWVGKFETGGTATEPLIKPNISSLRSQKVSAEFTTAQIFGTSTYGMTSNVDAHMMKNSEWGAVAYLSHSRYGVNREIYINNSSGYYTGRSGGNVGGSTAINTVYTSQTSTTQYNRYGFYTWDGYLLEYDTNTKSSTHDISKVASTTGNITGVYDMSGGADEHVMGVLADDNGNPRSGYNKYNNSGYNGVVYDDGNNTQYTNGVDFPNAKYYDLYTTATILTACNGGICYGHGLSEVSNWYGDYDVDSSGRFPWFERGGDYGHGSDAGAFSFTGSFGKNSVNDKSNAARSVILSSS